MNAVKQTMRPICAFTLVEVLVVLAILGIACLVILPMISNTHDMQASSATRQIVSTILYAQTLAISRQKEYQVVFDSVHDTYSVRDASGNVAEDPSASGRLFQIDYDQDDRLPAVDIESAVFDGGSVVWFDRMGAPYSGTVGSGPPLTTGNVILSAGETRFRIDVIPVSGRVQVTEL